MDKRLILLDRKRNLEDSKEIIHGHHQKGIFQKGCATFKDADTGIVLYEELHHL